jgi:hypothetical protein
VAGSGTMTVALDDKAVIRPVHAAAPTRSLR